MCLCYWTFELPKVFELWTGQRLLNFERPKALNFELWTAEGLWTFYRHLVPLRMQAIILAAGMGRRLGEYTKDNTKCMLPVNGVRLIDRVLTQLSPLGLTRVVIVVGYQGQNLMDYLGHRYDDQFPIEYVENPIYDKTNNIYSLALAKQQLQEDDTLLI